MIKCSRRQKLRNYQLESSHDFILCENKNWGRFKLCEITEINFTPVMAEN